MPQPAGPAAAEPEPASPFPAFCPQKGLPAGSTVVDIAEVGYKLRLDAVGSRVALMELCARNGWKYDGIVADSFFFMRAPSTDKQTVEKAAAIFTEILCRTLRGEEAAGLRMLSPMLLDPEKSYHFWPEVLAVATEHTLEEAARVMQKKVKSLLSSDTFVPCIIASLARRAAEAGAGPKDAGDPGDSERPGPSKHLEAPVAVVSEYPHLEPFAPGVRLLQTPSCRCLKQGAKSELERDMGTIYVTDTDKEVGKKVSKGFCEPRDIQNNPILDYFELVVLPLRARLGASGPLSIESTEGGKEFSSMESLRDMYSRDVVQPPHLKKALTEELCAILRALREGPEVPALGEILKLKPKK